MKKYLIIIEMNETSYSAYSPDLPGWVATGSTKEEVERNMQEAVELHVIGLLDDGLPIPEPRSSSEYVVLKDPIRQAA